MQGLIPSFLDKQLEQAHFQGTLDAVILFADLQGFTNYTEAAMARGKAGAETLAGVLNALFGAAATAIHSRGGFIPHFAGDAFAGIFPRAQLQAAREAAADIHASLLRHQTPMALRLGIGSGEVHWTITPGIPHRWWLRGPGINDAVRAEQQAGPGQTFEQPHCRNLPGQLPPPETLSLAPFAPRTGQFYPAQLMEHLQGAAFRQVTSLFVAFPETLPEATLAALADRSATLIEHQGGYVKEIDFTDKGGLLVSFFGAPTSVGDSRKKAIETALQLRDHPDNQALPLRCGLASGMAFCGLIGNDFRRQYIIAGRAVNLAARLALQAEPGQIRSDDETSRHLPLVLLDLGAIPAKGFATPIPVRAIQSLLTTHREDEQLYHAPGLLQQIRQWCQDDTTQLLQLTGEAGTGKSYLAARALPGPTLRVEGHPLHNQPFQALEQAAAREAASDAAYQELATELNKLRQQEGLPARERYQRQEEAFRKALQRPAPLLIWTEHWHDLDLASQGLLDQLLQSGRIRLLLTTRQRLNTWDDLPVRSSTIAIPPIAESGIRQLCQYLLGHLPGPQLSDLLLRTAGGNPFFTEQLTLYLRDNHLLTLQSDDTLEIAPSGVALGDSLKDILLARIDRLSASARQLLLSAAVLGHDFAEETLRDMLRLAGQPEQDFPVALQEALEADILRRDQHQLFFRHTLLSELLGEVQLGAPLRQAHLHALTALEHQPATASAYPQLAHHAREGGQLSTALEYYRQAGSTAIANFQNTEAIRFFAQARACTDQPKEQAALILESLPAHVARGSWQEALLELEPPLFPTVAEEPLQARRAFFKGQLLLLTGQYPEAARHLEAAAAASQKSGDTAGVAQASRELSILYFRQGDYPRAETYIQRTLALLPGQQAGDHGLVMNLALIRMNQGRYHEAEDLLFNELFLRLQTGEQQPLPGLYTNLGVVRNEMGRHQAALESLENGYQLAEKAGNKLWMSIALGTRGLAHENLGNWDLALADYEADLRLARDIGDPQGTAIASELLGNLLIRKGQFTEGETLLQEALQTARTLGYRKGIGKCLLGLAFAHRWQERPEAALACWEEARQIALDMGNRRLLASAHLGMAECLLHNNQTAKALEMVEAVSADILSWEDTGLSQALQVLWWRLRPESSREDIHHTALDDQADPRLQAEAAFLLWQNNPTAAHRQLALDKIRTLYPYQPSVILAQRLQKLHA